MAAKHYDIFISYDGEDRPWAEKMAASLRKKNLDVFLDRLEMRTGAQWRPQLKEALDNSDFLLTLWSSKAAREQWVTWEAATFEGRFNSTGEDPTGQHRMIHVLLDEDNKPYSHLQQVPDLKEANAYAGGAAQVDQELWDKVVEDIYRTTSEDQVRTPVSLLILTTTRERLQNLNTAEPADHLDVAPPLDTLLSDIGLEKSQLLERYHDVDRSAWKPYGAATVMQMLAAKRDTINTLLQTKQFRWESLGEGFWSRDQNRIVEEGKKVLAPHLAVVVVDPIAFYDGQVYNRFNGIRDCLGNERAVVLVLPPFKMSPVGMAFREGVQRIALSIFRGCYEPGVHQMPYAQCSLSFDDDLDIQRSVLSTLRRYFFQLEARGSNPFTEVGQQLA